jgi:cyclophilin family peptidyl-prolyl cis-trans isomerase
MAAAIGVDFGTTKSCMAWFNPKTGQAELIRNAEGEEKTPSVVYFGEGETLVGSPAETMLEKESERRRVFASVKRNLIAGEKRRIDGALVTPVRVAAEILRKLKRDAETGHFYAPVTRAVIGHPAAFGQFEKDLLEKAAKEAGFEDVALIPEPVAAAIAYERDGLNVGARVLVYDLGGGTFDVAVLERTANGGFHLTMREAGEDKVGGDDFDRAIYDHCDEAAWQTLQRGLAVDDRIDLAILRACRTAKEQLSVHERATVAVYLRGDDGSVRPFEHPIDRATFEGLIGQYVDQTVKQTKQIVDAAVRQAKPIETVVLIGGASKAPLVQRRLREALPVEPRRWQKQDVAVALGAAALVAASGPGLTDGFRRPPDQPAAERSPSTATSPASSKGLVTNDAVHTQAGPAMVGDASPSPPTATTRCPYCGATKWRGSTQFCTSCGRRIAGARRLPRLERVDERLIPKQWSKPFNPIIDPVKSYRAMLTTSKGTIDVELFADDAPITVNNFVALAREGYYDGTRFHRIVRGFVIQGGDPTGTGTGGPGYVFADELPTRAGLDYERGTLAMANAGPNTNGSQFFICLTDLQGRLPKNYAIFGRVASGMDAVNAIAATPTRRGSSGEQSAPTEPVTLETVEVFEHDEIGS